ncbi:MAG: hypothetical protein HKN09_05690 [Saprospiraceae bacterium]|nr:hypothetical protein [Flavobacteriaceae bacterium]NNE26315.1 hypothetical protein [Saprospiraceae bacterium]
MIKFFRKIRYDLMTQNKTSKYIKYAIGEIILVVIGILIALQINNWNERNKEDKLEAEYYCRLLEDVQQDNEQISVLVQRSEERLSASNQAVRLLLQEDANKAEVGRQIALSIKAIYSDFKPNNSAFEDLKSGANLNLIKDKNVIKALNTYFNNIESLKSVIKINGQNAVDIYYAHDDSFENGKTPASMLYGRFKEGMESDIYEAIAIDSSEVLSKAMQKRLYNEALRYMSANTRQVELYGIIEAFSESVEQLLLKKCSNSND